MKPIIFAFLLSAVLFVGCKKCVTCPVVGGSYEVCREDFPSDEAWQQYIEDNQCD